MFVRKTWLSMGKYTKYTELNCRENIPYMDVGKPGSH